MESILGSVFPLCHQGPTHLEPFLDLSSHFLALGHHPVSHEGLQPGHLPLFLLL